MLSRALRAPWWIQGSLAVIAAAVAFRLTLFLHLHERPFLLPMIAVLVTALRSGLGAGMVCAVVTLLLANYYIIPPIGSFRLPSLHDAYELSVFGLTATIISLLAARGRQAQLTLGATVTSIADGVIVTDNAGRVQFLNPVAERMTGWKDHEAEGQPVASVFNAIDEDTRQSVPSAVERPLREGLFSALTNHTVLVCRDGTELAIASSGAPIKDVHQRIIGAVLVFRDVSSQRHVEAALKNQAEREHAARAEAERANRLKDEFLAVLSHELRTPLNAVMGWSHMLSSRNLSEAQQKQALAAISRNAQVQARLVEDVLDLSRMITGQLTLTSEPIDVADIVRTTAESVMPSVLGKRQHMELDLAPGTMVTGDPHRLRQVVWNLLSNATKFTPDGGTIRVRCARAGARIELSVTDDGEGIDPSFLPFVFERFRQADSSATRGHGGLGLGLSLVRHLVEAHGGTAAASSEGPGKGATVSVSLPARQMPARPAAADSETDDLRGRRVLVLEDNDDARMLTAMMLETMGAEVVACGNVAEALDTMTRREPDVIVADLALPGHDGLGFLREVRERGVRVPALAVTAYSEPERREEAYAAGFGGLLSKPVTPEKLHAELRSLLQNIGAV